MDHLVDPGLVVAGVEPVVDGAQIGFDDAVDAGLFADLAQGGHLVGLAGFDPAFGQSPDPAAGRPDQAQLEGPVGANDHAARRELVSDVGGARAVTSMRVSLSSAPRRPARP